MFITFLVSALAHELVMSCITKKLRGYGFLLMMLQLPIIAVQRSPFVRRLRTWNVSLTCVVNRGGWLIISFFLPEHFLLVLYDIGPFYGKSARNIVLELQLTFFLQMCALYVLV